MSAGSAGSLAEHGQSCGIVSLDYAPSLQSLAVVFEDSRCAVCRTPEGGLLPVEGVQLSHFICRAGSGAVCARIGAPSFPIKTAVSFRSNVHLSRFLESIGMSARCGCCPRLMLHGVNVHIHGCRLWA